jgi:uncharacterized cupredoxin-like copper-binding protein
MFNYSLKRSTKLSIIFGIVSVVLIAAALTVHFRLSESERNEIESGTEQNEKESASEITNEVANSLLNKPESEENEIGEEYENTLPSYVRIVDGVQVVTVNAKEFKFTPSEIHINAGKAKFILINSGVGTHEFVVYNASKKDIVDKAELAEDEETIMKNVLFEIDELDAGQSKESDTMIFEKGSYVIGCHIPGHYEAGMNGTLIIE